MKIQNMIRMQALVVGFGAALLMASAAPAQEIDNPTWDEGTNSVPFTQPAAPPVENSSNTAVAGHPSGATPSKVVGRQITSEASVIPQEIPIERWTIAALVVCLALVVVYAREEKKRSDRYIARSRAAREQHGNGSLISIR